jgi:hypothetical protein
MQPQTNRKRGRYAAPLPFSWWRLGVSFGMLLIAAFTLIGGWTMLAESIAHSFERHDMPHAAKAIAAAQFIGPESAFAQEQPPTQSYEEIIERDVDFEEGQVAVPQSENAPALGFRYQGAMSSKGKARMRFWEVNVPETTVMTITLTSSGREPLTTVIPVKENGRGKVLAEDFPTGAIVYWRLEVNGQVLPEFDLQVLGGIYPGFQLNGPDYCDGLGSHFYDPGIVAKLDGSPNPIYAKWHAALEGDFGPLSFVSGPHVLIVEMFKSDGGHPEDWTKWTELSGRLTVRWTANCGGPSATPTNTPSPTPLVIKPARAFGASCGVVIGSATRGRLDFTAQGESVDGLKQSLNIVAESNSDTSHVDSKAWQQSFTNHYTVTFRIIGTFTPLGGGPVENIDETSSQFCGGPGARTTPTPPAATATPPDDDEGTPTPPVQATGTPTPVLPNPFMLDGSISSLGFCNSDRQPQTKVRFGLAETGLGSRTATVVGVWQKIKEEWVRLGTHASGQTYLVAVDLNGDRIEFALDVEVREANGTLIEKRDRAHGNPELVHRPPFTRETDKTYGLIDVHGAERWWNENPDHQSYWNDAHWYIWDSGCNGENPPPPPAQDNPPAEAPPVAEPPQEIAPPAPEASPTPESEIVPTPRTGESVQAGSDDNGSLLLLLVIFVAVGSLVLYSLSTRR